VSLYLGVPGNLLAIRSPARGVDRSSALTVVDQALLSGRHRTQRIGTPRTQYKLHWPWLAEADVRVLRELWLGTYGPGPLAFFDPAEVNLLPPNIAAGTTQLADTTGWNATVGTISSATSTLALRGRALQWVAPASGALVADLNAGATVADLTPVRAGVTYTARMQAWLASGTGFSGAAELEWYDVSGAVIGSAVQGSGVALTTSPQQLTVTAAAPTGSAYVQVTLTNSALTSASLTVLTDRWALRQAAGDDGTWSVGPAAVRVSILELPLALQLATPGSRHDVDLTLQEVG
jgi:hypothetical protein